jgi:uroporphyrinogen-III synthase
VYTTSAHPATEHHVSDAIEALQIGAAQSGRSDLWLVCFSPSTAGYALPHLAGLLRGKSVGSYRVRVAAIGEKTLSFLFDSGVEVDAVADEPNAFGLVQAIRKAA